jgi:hypothetical protein
MMVMVVMMVMMDKVVLFNPGSYSTRLAQHQ